jgi:hypothetical protein
MYKPFIVVVTGRPGSGKTTLAHRLAHQVHCPALCRDEFKEGFVHTMAGSHNSLGNDLNRHLNGIFFDIVQFITSRNISLVIEAAFQHKLWEPKLLPLIEIANVAIIVCSIDPHIARSRFIKRGLADPTRERFHGDSEEYGTKNESDVENMPIKSYIPPKLNVPTLSVDTTNGYEPGIDYIVSFIMQSCSSTNDKVTNK